MIIIKLSDKEPTLVVVKSWQMRIDGGFAWCSIGTAPFDYFYSWAIKRENAYNPITLNVHYLHLLLATFARYPVTQSHKTRVVLFAFSDTRAAPIKLSPNCGVCSTYQKAKRKVFHICLGCSVSHNPPDFSLVSLITAKRMNSNIDKTYFYSFL